MTKCIGFWKLDHNDENYDEYLKAIGVGFARRQILKRVTTWERIVQDDDVWTFDSTSSTKNVHLKFKLSEEFTETAPDGRCVKTVFNIEDDKLVQYQTATEVGLPDSVIVREVTDWGAMKVTHEAIGKGVKSSRLFLKQERTI